MVLIRHLMLPLLLLAMALGNATQAEAHENQQRAHVEKSAHAPGAISPSDEPARPDERAEAIRDAEARTFPARLMRWVGRSHPFAVHFPIALFPVALVALVLARRRGEPVLLIRSLIIVAGASSVAAALFGWMTGGAALADQDPIQTWHRWIGTALAVAGGLIAIAAWRRPDVADSRAMVLALALGTLLLLIQGWLGAVLVHGMEHMRF